ncbi:tail fiber domain-containing protein [Citrobacter braakii]|uniref:tail fiber domain-containing protein n=1 Tax=Citrobacter braakii TaxID=57706 RepID=UPI0024B13E7D|nr:tail fiber domain-containing protein [Citrobacter braakii]WFX02527.1 tail fiber domain-containing protein [Citrobacter braakii]
MSAGTLTLTNNSAAVSGSGTAFTTELATGDFIVVTVGGIPYTLPVKTINSNTSLTLVSNFTGPTQSGAAWYAVPRIAMNLVTAAVVTQAAEALRGLNYDKQNWQKIFSGTGTITVKLPDGSTYSGPAWNDISSALEGKADKDSKEVNTSWSVIRSDASAPAPGVNTTGGIVNSSYKIANVEVARASFSASHSVISSGFRNVNAVLEVWSTNASASWSFNHAGYITVNIPGGIFNLQADPGVTGGVSANGDRFVSMALRDQNTANADAVGKTWMMALNGVSGLQFIARNRAQSNVGQLVINMPYSNGTLALQGTSGLAYKHDVTDADLTEAVNRIDALRMVNFVYNDDEQERLRFGIIAEEAEKVAPQYIKHNSEEIADIMDEGGNKTGAETRDRPSVDNNPIVMDLLGYVKHLKAEIEMLKTALKG